MHLHLHTHIADWQPVPAMDMDARLIRKNGYTWLGSNVVARGGGGAKEWWSKRQCEQNKEERESWNKLKIHQPTPNRAKEDRRKWRRAHASSCQLKLRHPSPVWTPPQIKGTPFCFFSHSPCSFFFAPEVVWQMFSSWSLRPNPCVPSDQTGDIINRNARVKTFVWHHSHNESDIRHVAHWFTQFWTSTHASFLSFRAIGMIYDKREKKKRNIIISIWHAVKHQIRDLKKKNKNKTAPISLS